MDDAPDLVLLVEESRETLGLLARIAGGRVCVRDRSDEVVWESKGAAHTGACEASLDFRIEAEPVGTIHVCAEGAEDVAKLAGAVLDGAYRRKLVVTMYEETLSDSYNELVGRNRELAELAESLEERVAAQTQELDEAHALLAREEKVAAIGRLAAGVAHELNTPLACVRSNLGALAEMIPAREETDEVLRESIELTERAAGIVSDLRGFSHVDDLGRVEVDLNEEIDRVLERVEVPSGVRLEKDYGTLPPVPVAGGHLTVALLHVLENARDAVASDGGKVRVCTALEDDLAVVVVSDSGPGIPPEVMRKLFDPFFTTKEIGKGVGLGLTVARDIARAHGGDLTVECPPDGGTLARLSLQTGKSENGL